CARMRSSTTGSTSDRSRRCSPRTSSTGWPAATCRRTVWGASLGPPTRASRPSPGSARAARGTRAYARWYGAPIETSPAERKGAIMAHRLAGQINRILENQTALFAFFSASSYATRDPADADSADFVAGNPQDMVLPEFVDAIRRWAIPQSPDWYAYKFNEPYAQAAAAEGLRRRRGIAFEDPDITMTDGGFAGLMLAIRTVTDPGDEVIFLSPPWFFYEAIIIAAGATPVRVRITAGTWDLDLDAIESAITERTSAIIVNSPNNPTGRIYPPEQLDALAGILARASERNGRPIYLVSDEAYSRIVYDDREFRSPTEFHPYSFLVYTYGKQLLTPGQRLGYIALPPTMPDREQMRQALMVAQLAMRCRGSATSSTRPRGPSTSSPAVPIPTTWRSRSGLPRRRCSCSPEPSSRCRVPFASRSPETTRWSSARSRCSNAPRGDELEALLRDRVRGLSALGHRPAAAGDRPARGGRRDPRFGAGRRLRDGRERPVPREPRSRGPRGRSGPGRDRARSRESPRARARGRAPRLGRAPAGRARATVRLRDRRRPVPHARGRRAAGLR